MALTAENIIDDAMKETGEPTHVGRGQLLTKLSRQDRLLTQMASQTNPGILATEASKVSVTDSGNKNGYSLQDAIHYREFVHVDSDDDEYEPISIIHGKHQDREMADPAGFLRGETFYPVDPDGDRWQSSGERVWFEPAENHEFVYVYVPRPTRLTAVSDTLQAPDMAYESLVSSLVLSILMEDPTATEAQIQAALQQRQGAVDAYRMQLDKQIHGRRTNPPGGGEESDLAWVLDEVAG